MASFGLSQSYSDEINNKINCLNASTSTNLYLDSGCSLDNWLNYKIVPLCQGKQVCDISINTTDLQGVCKPNYSNANTFFLCYACYSNV